MQPPRVILVGTHMEGCHSLALSIWVRYVVVDVVNLRELEEEVVGALVIPRDDAYGDVS